ncbi:penicillin-binding protein 2 [Novosphingobium sp.]|uniref:peptidoglycan D,D-transpeptidase FtsI family protein n=1 Tax=Novosphingobium sp. TaxID=1874826 RepID=UPI0031D435EA
MATRPLDELKAAEGRAKARPNVRALGHVPLGVPVNSNVSMRHGPGATVIGIGQRHNTVISASRVDLVNQRSRALTVARWRTLLVLIGFALIALIAEIRIAHLGLTKTGRSDVPSSAYTSRRAEIIDRNGMSLARAFPAYALWFNPKALGTGEGKNGESALVRSPKEVAQALVRIFPDEDVDALTKRLSSGEPGYLRRRILPDEANRVHALGEPALEFPRENERYYPQGSMGAHILGFVDNNGHGQVGLEKVYDQRLTDPAQRGTPMQLSIDARVQGALEADLAWGLARAQARSAAGIVMDVDTGEVVALASLPAFNPNAIDAEGAKHTFNLISSQPFELGSVIKPITVAVAIDNGVLRDMATRYPAGGQREVGGHLVHDDANFGASLNIPEALIHSSNIVLAQLGDQIGPQRMMDTFHRLGFGERPHIELPARGAPIWPRPDSHGLWTRVSNTTVAYGHGISITELHLACAYAALVNGGVWRPATLFKLDPNHIPEGRRIWKASTSARIRQLLRAIVSNGTGRSANAAGYRIGGKTGTAERSDAHGYHKDKVVTTFAAAFPMDKPRYVVISTLDEPQRNAATSYQRTAAWNAAPIVGRLIPKIGPLLGVMPDETRDIDISDIAPLIANGEGE